MKKENITRYFTLLMLTGLVLVTSCKKSIELTPTDSITTANVFNTTADIDLGIEGVYAGLSNVNANAGINSVSVVPGAAYDNCIYTAAIMSDEVRSGADNNLRNYGSEQKWQFDASNPGAADVTAAWINYYNVNDRANRVLAAIDNVSGVQATKDRQRGELLAIRAFCHLELLINYAKSYDTASPGVPIVLKSSVLGLPARNTFGEVIAQIKTDLTAAKGLIPASFTTTDNTRISKIAISAIQARVALYEKNWNDAITYSTEVINAVPLATQAQFPGIWTDASTAEVLFSLKRSSTSFSGINSSGTAITVTFYTGMLFRDVNNDVFFSPSFKEIDLFDKVNDIRYNSYIKQDVTLKEPWLVVKYTGVTGGAKYNNDKVFRTGEMYLIRAEANAEKATPDLGAASADLNTLRAARITNYISQTYATHDDLIAAVYTERMKELFAEGHRFFDLRRRNMPVVRDDRDLVVNPTIPKTLLPTDRNYTLPIPQAEIFANPNITNNPGY